MDKRVASAVASTSGIRGGADVARKGEGQMKPFTTLAAAIFALMGVAHLYRLIRPFDVVVGGTPVPQWASIVALLVTALLAFMLWREARRSNP